MTRHLLNGQSEIQFDQLLHPVTIVTTQSYRPIKMKPNSHALKVDVSDGDDDDEQADDYEHSEYEDEDDDKNALIKPYPPSPRVFVNNFDKISISQQFTDSTSTTNRGNVEYPVLLPQIMIHTLEDAMLILEKEHSVIGSQKLNECIDDVRECNELMSEVKYILKLLQI
jgi:hypothetical protein